MHTHMHMIIDQYVSTRVGPLALICLDLAAQVSRIVCLDAAMFGQILSCSAEIERVLPVPTLKTLTFEGQSVVHLFC